MLQYEVLLLGGCLAIVVSALTFFAAAKNDEPVSKSIVLFLGSGFLFYIANETSGGGLQPSDIPMAFSKLLQQMI